MRPAANNISIRLIEPKAAWIQSAPPAATGTAAGPLRRRTYVVHVLAWPVSTVYTHARPGRHANDCFIETPGHYKDSPTRSSFERKPKYEEKVEGASQPSRRSPESCMKNLPNTSIIARLRLINQKFSFEFEILNKRR